MLKTISQIYQFLKGVIVVVIVWLLDLQLPMESVAITTNIMGLNSTHGEVYNIMW